MCYVQFVFQKLLQANRVGIATPGGCVVNLFHMQIMVRSIDQENSTEARFVLVGKNTSNKERQ